MPITRVLQAPGTASFKLDLPTGLQKRIMDAGERRGGPGAHISVFPVPLERPKVSDLPIALWTGFCDEVSDDGEIKAVGIEWWMRGLLRRALPVVTGAMDVWGAVICEECGLTNATSAFTSVIGDTDPYVATVAEVASEIAARAGTFWRVNPDFTFRFMSPAERAAPQRRLLISEQDVAPVITDEWVVVSGRPVSTYNDGQVATRAALPVDADGNIPVIEVDRRLRHHNGAVTTTTFGISNAPNNIDTDRILFDTDVAGQWTIDVKVDDSAINPLLFAKPGDTVGCWSIKSGVSDRVPVRIGGWVAYPRMLPIGSITTPVTKGLGVAWFRNGTSDMVDLTPFVVWETSASTIQIQRTVPYYDDGASLYVKTASTASAGAVRHMDRSSPDPYSALAPAPTYWTGTGNDTVSDPRQETIF